MQRSRKLFQIRGVKLVLEIALIFLVFVAIKTYMQRNLVEGVAPPVQGTLLSGQNISLQAYKGQPVLLHFWATWCPVCKLEQNSIDAISKDHSVITIAMNSGNEQEIRTFLKEHHLTFPVLVDENSIIARQFGVQGVPTSFIISPDGNIAFTEVGYTTNWGLRLRLWLAGG
ncbi:protein disulfide oxidoreductase [Kaarinaea lacus]